MEKIKVGVIGSGAISDIYLTNMIQKFDNLEVIAIASKHIENAQKKAEQFGLRAYTTEDLLANPEVRLVVILTPVGSHFELIKSALLSGKHVYTEKTITDNLEQAKQLVDLANEKELYLGAAPDTFMGAAWQTARRAIDRGVIGDVTSFAISANRDNNILFSFAPFLREKGAGALFDYGVYYITALVSLLGPVKRVGGISERPFDSYTGSIPGSKDYGEIIQNPNESRISAILKLHSGASGTFHLNNDSIINDQAFFAIYGTKGILYLTDPNEFGGEVKLLRPSIKTGVKPEPVTLLNFADFAENSRGIGPSDLAGAAINKTTNRASKEMAYHVLEVLTAVLDGGECGEFTDIKSTCEKPLPLQPVKAPVVNIGHSSFSAKNMDEMLHFYCGILGMKRLFTLTTDDLIATLKNGGVSQEQINNMHYENGKPWIEYLKLADRQYIELFHDMGEQKQPLTNRQDYYGFLKQNYEVDDIKAIKQVLVTGGVTIDHDIHKTIDGSLEIMVHDPDGNEVQFTQYMAGESAFLKLTSKPNHDVCTHVKFTTQMAYQIKDEENMLSFYCDGLGLKHAASLSFADLASAMESAPGVDIEKITQLKILGSKSWIDYIEVGPHQYIELFHVPGESKKEARDLNGYYNYQHLCIETDDIFAAKKALLHNGVVLDRDISLGCEGAYQLWVVDPDGNRIEFMEYTKDAMQLL